MNPRRYDFIFGNFPSSIVVTKEFPSLEEICQGKDAESGFNPKQVLVICDANTEKWAHTLCIHPETRLHVLVPGEEYKTWSSVESILVAAAKAGLGRDSLFIGVGGGVVTDLTAFAAAIYMRGIEVRLVSTSLLGMVDAALGGKTGFDLEGIKNLVGAFHVADHVYMPICALESLPPREWKSGMAELIKTAIIGDPELYDTLQSYTFGSEWDENSLSMIEDAIARCVAVKGRIVAADPKETGSERALLNLGHTFGHALEATAGLGRISHGEGVAWGIARACDLAVRLGTCSEERRDNIKALLVTYGYDISRIHPALTDLDSFMDAMSKDKKKVRNIPRFVVPTERGALLMDLKDEWASTIRSLL